MPAVGKSAQKVGFTIPPHALFTVQQEDIRHLLRKGEYSFYGARRKVIRERILSLVQREDPPTNLNDIICYAFMEGYL
jgi:hypothetical protein